MKTINRSPMSVKQLDYSDVNYKFFNHVNWKGMCEDKNYMGVDQETFAECDNVYIDEDSILKSRPSIKNATKDLLYSGGIIKNVKCINNYVFVCWNRSSSSEYRLFIYKYTDKYTLIKDELLAKTTQAIDIKYLTKNNKVYLFNITTNVIFVFDFTSETLTKDTVGNSLYSPVKEAYINGKLISENAEQTNEFYNGYRKSFKWLYNSESSYGIDNFVNDYIRLGKNSTDTKITINDDTEVIGQLDETTSKKLVAAGRTINNNNYLSYKANNRTYSLPLINYKNGVLIITTISDSVDDDGNSIKNYTIEYSYNNKTFNTLPSLGNCQGIPCLSDTGDTVFVISNGKIFAKSLLPNEYNTFVYGNWTDVLALYNNTTTYTFNTYSIISAVDYKHFIFTHKGSTDTLTEITYYNGTIFSKTQFTNNDKTITYEILDFPIIKLNNDNIYAYALVHNSDASSTNAKNILLFSNIKNQIRTYLRGDNAGTFSFFPLFNKGYFTVTNNIVNLISIVPSTVYERQWIYITTFTEGTSNITNFIRTQSFYIDEKFQNFVNIIGTTDEFLVSFTTNLYYCTAAKQTKILPSTTYSLNVSNITYLKDNTIYSQDYVDSLEILDEYKGTITIPIINDVAELNNYYVSSENTLYISSTGAYDEDNELWYFPKINTQKFDFDISNLHPISSTEVAIFLEESIYYVSYDSNAKGYRYYKSRIELGCKKGADIVTTYDNKYTIFTTKRGLVAMSYQDFVSSTEQALTYLSDNIFEHFNNWNTTAVKLQLYKFWIICYRINGNNTNTAFVYDLRNSSWWPISFKANAITQFVEMPDKLRIVKDYFYDLDTSDYEYYDVFGKDKNIDWYIKSQKLHFNAINYYKHIVNITLFAVSDNQTDIVMNLKVRNYRKTADYGKNLSNSKRIEDGLTYKVDMTRTFVKRLNYYKLNEFEYTLTNYSEETNTKILDIVPLSLTSISIKYLITGQVR